MENNENKENNDNKKENVVAGETQKIEIINEDQLKQEDKKSCDTVNKEEKDAKGEAKKEEKGEIKKEEQPVVEEVKKNEEDKNVTVSPVRKEKKLSKGVVAIIVFLCVIITLIISFGIIVCVNKLNRNVYKNVKFLGKDISSFTAQQVEKIIDDENEIMSGELNIDVYQKDKKIGTVESKNVELKIDKENTVKRVIGFGREGNIFINNFNIIKALFSPVIIEPEYTYNEEGLNEILKNIDVEIDGRFVDDTYNVDEVNKKLIVKRGKSGNALNYNTTKDEIFDKIKAGETLAINVNLENKTPTKITAEEIYSKVAREAKDASIDKTKKPVLLVNEVYGINFDKNELQKVLDKEENQVEEKEIEFALNFIEPKVKLRDISYDLCLDKLAGLTTYFDASQTARANNLKIALSYLNDQLIMPGEIFSYNAVIGDTTYAKGYLPAAVFKGGRSVNELGGGICQTSSTLYNVALLANLEIVERYAHGLPVGYVRPSLDATVYGDVLDFKFKNTRNYPIKIVTSFSSGGEMNISIYGTKEEVEYDITLVSNYLYTVNYKTTYIQDPSLEEGVEQVVYNGVNGYASNAYIIKKLNGQVVENRFLSKDVYNAQNKTVRVGTAKKE